MLLPRMFILSYTTIYIFVKIFFRKVYISVNTIFECSYLSFGRETGHPLNMYVTRGMKWIRPKFVQIRTGREGYHASCVRTHSYTVSFLVFVLRFLVLFVVF